MQKLTVKGFGRRNRIERSGGEKHIERIWFVQTLKKVVLLLTIELSDSLADGARVDRHRLFRSSIV
jgi:hypothetical protein